MKNRSKILKVGLLAVMGVIVLRLFWIQVVEYGTWTAKAAAQQTLKTTIKADRGEIYMMDGEKPKVVVMNESVWTVVLDPMVADREEVEKKIKEILPEAEIDWNKAFANEKSRYFVLAKNVGREQAEKIAEADLTGIWQQETTKRVYPEGELAAAMLGFVNADGEGQYGVERELDNELAGEDGLLKTVKDINNVALSIGSDNVKIPAKDGKNIVLTLDRNLQYGVERALAETTQKMGKTNASAVVMDPNNGKVLAMATYPGYDPANYGKVKDASVYTNVPTDSAYEPASVCKAFTFAAAVNEGVMKPDSTYTNTGSTMVDGWEIKNAEQGSNVRGTIPMQTALNYSLNTGSIQALRWIGGDANNITQKGREKLYEYFHDKFGFGLYTGVELHESAGLLNKPNEGYGLNSTYANMTFGQNMQTTMIQVAAAFSSIVNGGDYYQPTIVAGEMVDGKFKEKEAAKPLRQTVSAETSATMREMLYGTRRAWRTAGVDQPGYMIGGKTGTAQTIKNGAYQSADTVATYIGYGATEGELPSYVIMVRIWKDGTYTDGQQHALPLFNALKAYVQDYLRVRPKGE